MTEAGVGSPRSNLSRRSCYRALVGLAAALILTGCTSQQSGAPTVDSTPAGFAAQVKQICRDDAPKFDAVTKELTAATDPRPGMKKLASVMNAELARLSSVVAPASLNGTYQAWIGQLSQGLDRTTKVANAADVATAYQLLGTTDEGKPLNAMAKTLGILPECVS